MRLRIYAGILGLGIGLGAFFGLRYQEYTIQPPGNPLVREYIELVGVLYAKGEPLEVARARLHRLGYRDTERLIGTASDHNGGSDLEGILATMASRNEPTPPATQRVLAGGPGASSTPTPTPTVGPKNTATPEPPVFPARGLVPGSRDGASLRALPTLDAPILRIVPGGTEVSLLGVQSGQPVEGNEVRWYQVEYRGATGYIYYPLVEREEP